MESDETISTNNTIYCNKCQNLYENNDVDYNNGTINKCRQWLNSCSLSEESEYSLNLSTSQCILEENPVIIKSHNVALTDKIVASNNDKNLVLENIIGKEPNQYSNIQIYKSQNVHIGNVTNINGPVYINQLTPTINQTIIINTDTNSKKPKTFPMVSRRTWLAQPPLDQDEIFYFTKPPTCVIIMHSATEEAYSQTDNNLLVRLIQQFHVESRKWNDIAYNFLIGADGSVYEGRGWKIVGSHTIRYNVISIGICLIGCYMKKTPPLVAIKQAKALIKHGVEIGAIAENYTLLGHCQCTSTESPGWKLFEEIQTWDRWDGSVSVGSPLPQTETGASS